MSICKSSLEKLGKAAFKSLSAEDQQRYITASKVVGVITNVIKTGDFNSITSSVGVVLTGVGIELGTKAVLSLAASITGEEVTTLSSAAIALVRFVTRSLSDLVDQVKHDIANKLAVLFGIKENPGIISAIMEWIYRSLVKPVLA